MMKIFDQIDIEIFLNEYWEKKPFIFRGIKFDKENVLKIEDLMTMATEEYYETRAIFQNEDEWCVEDGPFESDEFQDHNKKWTFIAHNLEHYLPEINRLKSELDFLPRWLFDDVMSTYSSKGSSVGAHIDNYNVFIMQTLGQRKWMLQANPNHEYIENLPVRILKEFNPDQEFILEEGDMIYIPPHIAHHGISQSESISLSFGYKSIEKKSLIDQLSVNWLNKFESDDFFRMKFTQKLNETNKIDNEMLEGLQEFLIKELTDKTFINRSIASLSSESKRPTEETEITRKEFDQLKNKEPLFKDEFVRFCFIQEEKYEQVFINQHMFTVSKNQRHTLEKILSFDHQTEIWINELQDIENELFELTKLGILFFDQ